jgi:hypothetical protein
VLRRVVLRVMALRNAAARFSQVRAYIFVMSYLRVRIIKGRGCLYRQTSVRKGKKVKTISEYLGALFWAPLAEMSPGKPGGYGGHKSTDKRANKHQENYNREKFDKEMRNPRERFVREAAKAATARAGRVEAPPDPKVMEAAKEFNERREAEKEPPGPSKQL